MVGQLVVDQLAKSGRSASSARTSRHSGVAARAPAATPSASTSSAHGAQNNIPRVNEAPGNQVLTLAGPSPFSTTSTGSRAASR